MNLQTVSYILPEIAVTTAAVVLYMAGAFFSADRAWRLLALVGLLAAGVLLAMQPASPLVPTLYGDAPAHYCRWFALVSGVLFVLLHFRPHQSKFTSETLGSLLFIIAGAMLVAVARDIVLLFVGLEMISIPTYIILYLGRRDAACQESAVKYFYLSVLASAMFLYGLSFLYGVAGSTQLDAIQAKFAAGQMINGFGPFAKIGLIFLIAGLSFRITAVPFHFYAPDVYQGTTHPNAALLSVIPKLAGFVVLIRLMQITLPGMEKIAWQIAMVLSILTMSLGNTMALWQGNLRRLFAYSSIAHGGYMLLALSAAVASETVIAPDSTTAVSQPWNGIGAILFYIVIYASATIGCFALFEMLGREENRAETVEELAGLGANRPLVAALLAIFLFSLAGIPPLAGFWGKLQIFGSALDVDANVGFGNSLQAWFIGAAIVGVLNAAIAAAYYLRVVSVMYFRPAKEVAHLKNNVGLWTAACICLLLTLVFSLFPGQLMKIANGSLPAAVSSKVK